MFKKVTSSDGIWYDVSLHQQRRLNQHLSDLQSKLLPTWDKIRKTRDTLLKASDWTQMPDSPLTAEKRAEWADYRQALRDLPDQNINSIVWPQQPE